MQNLIFISITVFFLLLCFFLIKNYKIFAVKSNFLDTPDELSNHKNKLPTGVGIIFVFLIGVIYLSLFTFSEMKVLNLNFPNRHYLFILSIIGLGIISFIDDIKSVHFLYRFLAHIVFVMASTPLLSNDLIYPIPEKLSLMIIIFLWVYIINIFNFLDGANGYLSINSIFIFISYLITLISSKFFLVEFNFYIVFFTTLILMVYLYFNFPTALVFCGDSGSIIIGYIIGYIFFDLANSGYWHIAVAILSYPILDVTLTILNKMKNGNYPWERLFDYYYLRALNKLNKDHKIIFNTSLIFNSINLIIIISMLILNLKWLCLLSLILAFSKIFYFNNLVKK